MDKKILASIACIMAVAMLSACGSQEDPSSGANPDYSKYFNIESPDTGTNDKADPDSASNIEAKKTGYDGNIIAGVTFTGSLGNRPILGDNKDTIGIIYDVDHYTMKLKRSDSLYITIENYASPFRLRFYGPCYATDKSECADTTIVVKNKTASLKYRIKSGHEEQGSTVGDLVNFYLKIFNSFDGNQDKLFEPNNYLVSVRVVRF
jgi:hypothetical protein